MSDEILALTPLKSSNSEHIKINNNEEICDELVYKKSQNETAALHKSNEHMKIKDNDENNSEETSDELVYKKSQNEAEAAVRSVAVVKKSQVEFPVSFRELQSNTDLKTPPSNWLRGQFSICFPNITPRRSDFTSFIMGYQFPDCIGEVDIVSDAENIKKLLKMAYHPNTHLSMMVHRIGKTILIDEFDIYKYLLRQSECKWKWLRKFFYEHVLESLARKEENVLVRPNKSRDVVQRKNLLSKFLYHSIGEEKVEEGKAAAQSVTRESPGTVRTISSPTKDSSLEVPVEEHLLDSSVQSFTRNIIWNFEDVRMLIGTDLPIFGGRTHPCVSLRLRDMDKPINILTGIDYWLDNLMCNVPEVVMCYHQNGIVQKYELIKTEDLPHMPDSQFSPQLVRDIAHNILSFLKSKATKEGHTYWLFKGKDDDIVKLYDLTSLCHEDGPFESFSSSEGNDNNDESADNPFTVHVAMLFYCVAKNMWNSKEATNKITTIKSLLENALKLLRKDKYPKIFCQSHLILADLYLPQDADPDCPRFFDLEEGEIDMTKRDKNRKVQSSPETSSKGRKKKTAKECECNSINLSTLCCRHGLKGSKLKGSDPAKLNTNVYERCDSAIDHVIVALNFLMSCPPEVSPSSPSANFNGGVAGGSQTSAQTVPDEPRMARQYEPIPMHYEPLHKPQSTEQEVAASSSTLEKAKEELPVPTSSSNSQRGAKRRGGSSSSDRGRRKQTEDSSQNHQNEWFLPPAGRRRQNALVSKTILTGGAVLNSHLKDASWKDKMSFQLLRKASLVYMTKGRIELNEANYGMCLRYVNLALRAWCGMLSILGLEQEFPLPTQPLLLAGDAYYNLSKCWTLAPSHFKDFENLTEEQKQITVMLDRMVTTEEKRTVSMPSERAQAMMFSYQAFEAAMNTTNADPDFELKRRLAGICNELGCLYMNEADVLCNDGGGGIEAGEGSWERSIKYLDKAIDIFEEVEDNDNLALLYCNKGRYLRLYAFYSSSDGQQTLTPIIKATYEKAFEHYEKALDLMKSKQSVHKNVAESIVWEYSTTLFSYATIIQDTPYQEYEDAEDQTKYVVQIYDKCLKLCDTKSSSSKELLYQYRIAEIHIRLAGIYHAKFRRTRDSKMMHLAEMHYQKSAMDFINLDSSPGDIFKVHLDHVVLKEDDIEGMKSQANKWKAYLSILKLLVESVSGLVLIQRQKEEKLKEMEEANKGSKKKGKGKRSKKKDEPEETPSEEDEVLHSFLELYEKKLHSTLLAMLKIAKTSPKTRFEAEVKTMYCISLNKTNKPKDTHLLEAMKAITPIAKKLFTSFKL